MKKNVKKKSGFTLIELMIVISIIVVLAAIAVPKYASIQLDAKRKADFANAKVIADATLVAISNNAIFANPTIPTSTEIEKYLAIYPQPNLMTGIFTINVLDEEVIVSAVSNKTQTVEAIAIPDKDTFQLYPITTVEKKPY